MASHLRTPALPPALLRGEKSWPGPGTAGFHGRSFLEAGAAGWYELAVQGVVNGPQQ